MKSHHLGLPKNLSQTSGVSLPRSSASNTTMRVELGDFGDLKDAWDEMYTLQGTNISHLLEEENHLQYCFFFFRGYVSCQEGTLPPNLFKWKQIIEDWRDK